MEESTILSAVDHTQLSTQSTWADIRQLCDDALVYQTASVCIPPSYVKQAKAYLGEKLPVCTVIGFPNGYHTTAAKCREAADAVQNGADEIDMVINLGWVKDGAFEALLYEINAVKAACGEKLLKVIVETCCLTEDEKVKLCDIVSASNAEFIKTSTGFSTGGATLDDIRLFAAHMAPGKKIKAAGGIKSFADAQAFLEAGAHRLGTSSLVKIMKETCR